MKSVSLTAFPRVLSRRGGAKKLRAQGRVPAVIYGRHAKPQSLEINLKELENLIHHSVSENLLLDLSVHGDANKRMALLQDVQHHALSGSVLHVDLHEVAENEKVTVLIPVEPEGEAVGVKAGGGVLEHVLFKVKIRALPRDLPEVVSVDVTHLNIGQAIHLGDIKLPAGVEIIGDKHISVLAVAAPITEAQEQATEGAPAGELEVIKEKKEEGAAAPAPAGKDKAAEKAPEKGEKKAEKKK